MKFPIHPIKAYEIVKIAEKENLASPQENNIIGNREKEICFIANNENCDKETLTFYTGTDRNYLSSIKAGIIIINANTEDLQSFKHTSDALIPVKNPSLLFVKIVNTNYKNTFTGHTEKMFSNVKTAKNVYIENNVLIGEGSEIYPFVSIFSNSVIGSNCRIQSSTVIGSIGMGYAAQDDAYIERFTHLGGVIIADNVDIGANTTIVKGILQNTVIGEGTKIGNHVNIGHNVSIGRNCFISSDVTLCGSVVIEDGCWLAPGVKVLNKVIVKRNTQLGIGAVASKNTEPDSLYLGYPAKRIGKRK